VNNSFDHATANEEKWNRRALTYDNKRYSYFRLMQKALISTFSNSVSYDWQRKAIHEQFLMIFFRSYKVLIFILCIK